MYKIIVCGKVLSRKATVVAKLCDEKKFNIKTAKCTYNNEKFDGHKIEHIPYEQDYDSRKFKKLNCKKKLKKKFEKKF